MRSEKPTMADIAKALGISSISVSRALSGQEGVGEELREKVFQKAGEMGYLKPKSPQDSRILVLHQKPFVQDSSNYSRMVQGIERALQDVGCGYDMEYVDKSRQEKLYLPCKVAKGAAFDGLLYIGGFESGYVAFMGTKIRNQVIYTGYSPGIACDSVWYNYNNGGYRQCRYLLDKGHQRIGFIGSNSDYINSEKTLGIETALRERGIQANQKYFIYDQDDFEDQVKALLGGEGPTAFICQWDYSAVRLIKFLYGCGVRVPEDVSVIGSGNTEMSALFMPALTTMELHIDYACESAVGLLLKRIAQPGKPAENILISSTVVEGDSVRSLA